MKKILLLITLILLLSGCSIESVRNPQMVNYVDEDTCVIYLTRYEAGITPMYNQDGTLKLDKECLKK